MAKKRYERATRPCPHCDYVKEGCWTKNQRQWHLKKCRKAHPAQRLYFKLRGGWPEKREYPLWVLRQIDPELAIEQEEVRPIIAAHRERVSRAMDIMFLEAEVAWLKEQIAENKRGRDGR